MKAPAKANLEVTINYFSIAFLNGYLIMVTLGALGHQLHIRRLFIGYWSGVLICLLAEILFSPATSIAPYLRAILKLLDKEQ